MPWPVSVHLGLFVHRVDGLDPGLYALVREPTAHDELRDAMRSEFLWEQPAGTPPELPLHLVYNPGGPFLPPPQEELGVDYRRELSERFGIVFDHLLTFNNMPGFFR